MTEWILAGAVMVVAGAFLFSRYVRWFLGRVTTETPIAQVTSLSATEPGVSRFVVQLRGTRHPLSVIRVTAEAEGAEGLGVVPPEGFVPLGDSDLGPDTMAWEPRRRFELRPDKPWTLSVHYRPGGTTTTPLRVWLEARVGLGGIGISFPLVVGSRSEDEIQAANLRSELMARAREAGIVPRELPEWERLETLEAQLRRRRESDRR